MFHDIFLPIFRDHLRTELGLQQHECVAHISEQVLQHHGEINVNLYPGSSTDGPSGDQHHGIEQVNGFSIGITFRTGKCSRDRMFPVIYKKLLPLARKVMIVMRRDRWQMADLVNQYFAGDPVGPPIRPPTDWKLVEPFFQLGQTAEVTLVGPKHFGADGDNDRLYGVWLPIEYGNSRFMAHLDSSGTQSGDTLLI